MITTEKIKRTTRWYWAFTFLFAAFMLLSAIPDLLSMELARQGFAEIRLPAFLLPFLGFAKTLGVIALLVPGFPRLREWAYAGLFFDLAGAIYCIAAAGKPAGDWLPVFLPVLIGALSYHFYRRKNMQENAPALQLN